MSELALTYSLADQEFCRTKSLGVLGVSLELARHLARRSEVARLHVLGNSSVRDAVPRGSRARFTSYDEATRGRAGRILWDQVGVYQAALRTGNDLLLLPKGFAPVGRRPPMRLVTYVHDTLIHRYEKDYPRGFPLLERKYFTAGFHASLKHSSLILTNSAFTTSEIRTVAAKWGQTLPPIVTVGVGISPDSRPELDKDERIVVLASRLPHKRTDLALAYVARWIRETRFAGFVDWVGELPCGFALPECRNGRLHARMPEAEYRPLLRRARALVYVSEYEGFGMPPVEAAASGTSPVYSSIPATLEVMGGVGFPFENGSFGSFSAAMTAGMAARSSDVLASAAPLLARHHWDAVARRVTAALAEIA